MADSRIFGDTAKMIGKALEISAKRHNLIAGNIANMDTIGYNPKDFDFKKTLKRAMDDKKPDFLDKIYHKHLTDNDEYSSAMNGENSEGVDIYHLDSVNIDTQMMNLMENNIKYHAATEMLLRKMQIVNYSIDQGGR